MADAPGSQYVKGPPGPDQAPQGAATAMNEAAANIPMPQEQQASPPPASQEEGPQPPPVEFTPANDADKYLTAETAQPQKPVRPLQGLTLSDFGDWVPALAAAAARPDATPQVKALFQAVMLGPLP